MLPRRPRARRRHVPHRDRRRLHPLHWRLLSPRGQAFDGCRGPWCAAGRADCGVDLRRAEPRAARRQRGSLHEDHPRDAEQRWPLSHPCLRSRQSAGASADPGGVLGGEPEQRPEVPHLLRLRPRQEVHGRLRDVHRPDERPHQEAGPSRQSVPIQPHSLPQQHRGPGRLGAERRHGQSRNVADRAQQAAVRTLVLQQEERRPPSRLLCGGHTGQADHHHA
mmetsp:Transcript_16116/g.62849  ORF Transcript_16116/g.62849 Transcript_16116/m.62849 type:complete len:221 (+) Transcript_16116:507-1169(+)